MGNMSGIPKDLEEVMKVLLSKVKTALKEQFIGMYIHGSLALGDFNPNSSDIDFFVVIRGEISSDIFRLLEKIHSDISLMDNNWSKRLEGSYVNIDLLNMTKPPNRPRPYVNGNKLYLANHGDEWILEKYIIREYGIIIEGPKPKDLMDLIELKELQKASFNILDNWWKPMIYNKSKLNNSEYRAYAVLTMCRILYTINNGDIVSKKTAANWGLKTLDKRWGKLINDASKWVRGSDFNHIDKTIEFIKFVVKYSYRLGGI